MMTTVSIVIDEPKQMKTQANLRNLIKGVISFEKSF